MKNKPLLYTLLGIIIVLLLGYFVLRSGNDEGVPVAATYPEKIVYPLGSESTREEFEVDCKTRGGTFNECGTQCAPGAAVCTAVCVYTCEFGDARTSEEAAFRIGEPASLAGRTMILTDILEDSRCPRDVTCIQAGRVRATFQIGEDEIVLSTDNDTVFGDYTLRIKSAAPEKVSTSAINDASYKLTVEARR